MQPSSFPAFATLPDLDTLPPIRIQRLDDAVLREAQVTVDVVRLDGIDGRLGGNKWFKLLPFLHLARAQGQSTLLSFGGAYSNHIAALAAAGQRYGFRTVGVIRGEIVTPLNPVLDAATQAGMRLIGVSRGDYRLRHDAGFVQRLREQLGAGAETMVIPEGGAGLPGVQGCQMLARLLWPHVQAADGPCEILLPCGTGTTAAGLIAGLDGLRGGEPRVDVSVRGVAVLKGGDFLLGDVERWLGRQGVVGCGIGWSVETLYHAGGYGRSTPELRRFVGEFGERHGILIEPVYSGKLFYAVFERVGRGCYAAGTRLVVLHTGGV